MGACIIHVLSSLVSRYAVRASTVVTMLQVQAGKVLLSGVSEAALARAQAGVHEISGSESASGCGSGSWCDGIGREEQ